jgi:hypothetical protein
MDALHKLKVWSLVDLPQGCKAVKSKWVFKQRADGRYHAQLVAKGFTCNVYHRRLPDLGSGGVCGYFYGTEQRCSFRDDEN